MVWACTPKPTAIRPAAKAVCCNNFFIDLSPSWVEKRDDKPTKRSVNENIGSKGAHFGEP
jgi:hypothetical protein